MKTISCRRLTALLLGGTLLTGCNQNEKAYLGYETHVYDGVPSAAAIQVYGPQFYRRESLINDRREEEAYLRKQLKDSETAVFEPQLLREVEAISTLSAQLGLSFDPAAKIKFEQSRETGDLQQQIQVTRLRMELESLQRDLAIMREKFSERSTPLSTISNTTGVVQLNGAPTPPTAADFAALNARIDTLINTLANRLSATVSAPRPTTAKASPREEFLDRQALRDEIRQAINRASLDAQHDNNGRSLYRMQFRATVLPKPEHHRHFAAIKMQVVEPSENELKQVYLTWLAHLSKGLNIADGTIDARLRELALTSRTYDVLIFHYDPSGDRNSCHGKLKRDYGGGDPTESPCKYIAVAAPPTPEEWSAPNRTEHYVLQPKFEAPPATRDPVSQSNILAGKLANAPLPRNIIQTITRETQERLPSTAAPPSSNSPSPASSIDAELQRARTEAVSVCMTSLDSIVNAFALDAARSKATRALIAETVLNGAIRKSKFEVDAILDAAIEYDEQVFNTAARKHANTLQSKCPLDLPENFLRDNLLRASLTADATDVLSIFPPSERWLSAITHRKVDHNVVAYGVSPSFLGQRISTTARAADAVQLMASLTAALPAQGVGASGAISSLRMVAGKSDALERQPIVVGYGAAGERHDEFGWILGPRSRVDTEKQKIVLEHSLEPYELSADISMPSWWPSFKLKVYKMWAPGWLDGNLNMSKAQEQIISVPMRTKPSDMDRLTDLVIARSFTRKLDSLPSITAYPGAVSACHAGSIVFQIVGEGAWRTNEAYFGGLRPVTLPTVLPDMSGVAVEFDIKKLPRRPSGTAKVELAIFTPDGRSSTEIAVDGSQLEEEGCGPETASSPPVVNVKPSKLNACMNNRIYLKSEAGSIQSATLAGTPVTVANDNGLPKFDLSADWVKTLHVGQAKSLPLSVLLETPEGIRDYHSEIAVDFAACDASQKPAPTPTFKASAVPAGRLDLCSAAPRILVSAGAVETIADARLTGVAAVALSGKVTVAPLTGTADITFTQRKTADLILPANGKGKLELLGKNAKILTTTEIAVACGG